eukprot:gene23708-29956_t
MASSVTVTSAPAKRTLSIVSAASDAEEAKETEHVNNNIDETMWDVEHVFLPPPYQKKTYRKYEKLEQSSSTTTELPPPPRKKIRRRRRRQTKPMQALTTDVRHGDTLAITSLGYGAMQHQFGDDEVIDGEASSYAAPPHHDLFDFDTLLSGPTSDQIITSFPIVETDLSPTPASPSPSSLPLPFCDDHHGNQQQTMLLQQAEELLKNQLSNASLLTAGIYPPPRENDLLTTDINNVSPIVHIPRGLKPTTTTDPPTELSLAPTHNLLGSRPNKNGSRGQRNVQMAAAAEQGKRERGRRAVLPPARSVVDGSILKLLLKDFAGFRGIELWQAQKVLAIRLHDTDEKYELYLPLPKSLGGIGELKDLGKSWFERHFPGLVKGNNSQDPDKRFLLYLQGKFRNKAGALEQYYKLTHKSEFALKHDIEGNGVDQVLETLVTKKTAVVSPSSWTVKEDLVPRELIVNPARNKRHRQNAHKEIYASIKQEMLCINGESEGDNSEEGDGEEGDDSEGDGVGDDSEGDGEGDDSESDNSEEGDDSEGDKEGDLISAAGDENNSDSVESDGDNLPNRRQEKRPAKIRKLSHIVEMEMPEGGSSNRSDRNPILRNRSSLVTRCAYVGLRSQSLNSTNAKQAAGKELITSTINRPQTRSSAGTKVLPISGSSNNKTTGRPPTKPAVLKTRGSKKFSNTSSNISAKSGDRTPERHHSTDDPFDTRADQVSHHVSSSDDESVCDSLSLLSRVAASTSPLSTGTTSQQCVDDASLVNTAADLLGIMDGSESAFGTTSSFHSVTDFKPFHHQSSSSKNQSEIRQQAEAQEQEQVEDPVDFAGLLGIELWQAQKVLAIRLHDTDEKYELFLPLPESLGGLGDSKDLGKSWFDRHFPGKFRNKAGALEQYY